VSSLCIFESSGLNAQPRVFAPAFARMGHSEEYPSLNRKDGHKDGRTPIALTAAIDGAADIAW
jgi:hypothetical protein